MIENISRRGLLNTICSIPFLGLIPTFTKVEDLRLPNCSPHGIQMLFRYCKQHRWDVCNKFIELCYHTYPDIKPGTIEVTFQQNVHRMLANKDNIHFIEVVPSGGQADYRMVFYYVHDNLCLSVPIC